MNNFRLTKTVLVALVLVNLIKLFNLVDGSILPIKFNITNFTNTDLGQPKEFINLKDLDAIPTTDLQETFVGRRRRRRRKKYKKEKKLLRYLYPVIVTAVVAKMILIPLILKALTAISSSSFVMSKIAMLTSAVLVTKWLFDIGKAKDKTKVEIVQVPGPKYDGWDDRDVKHNNKKYIPVGGSNGWSDMDWNYDNDNGINRPFL